MIDNFFCQLLSVLQYLLAGLIGLLCAVATPGCFGLAVTRADTASQAKNAAIGSAGDVQQTEQTGLPQQSESNSPRPPTASQPSPSGPVSSPWLPKSTDCITLSGSFVAAGGGALAYAAGQRFWRSRGDKNPRDGIRTST